MIRRPSSSPAHPTTLVCGSIEELQAQLAQLPVKYTAQQVQQLAKHIQALARGTER